MSASFDPSARLRAAVHPVTLLVVAALIVLPWVEPDKFALHILSLIAIASIAAMGLQVLLGYSGQLPSARRRSTASAPTPPRC